MPRYHEVQRSIEDEAQLHLALEDALAEAIRNTGQIMLLQGFRQEEHFDAHRGTKTILVYAQFAPAKTDQLAELNPRDLNDAATANALVRGEGIPADQRFGSGETSDITPSAPSDGAIPL